MTLSFPNPSRSYDEIHRRVRFVGHDGMFQVPFSVEVDALAKSMPSGRPGEASYLAAFDAALGSIRDVAREAYANGRKTAYVLTEADFR